MSIADITQPSTAEQLLSLTNLLTKVESLEYYIRSFRALPGIPECDGYRETRWHAVREAIGQLQEALEKME